MRRGAAFIRRRGRSLSRHTRRRRQPGAEDGCAEHPRRDARGTHAPPILRLNVRVRQGYGGAVVRFAVPLVSSLGPTGTSGPFSVVAIIPARYDSTRLPGKALVDIAGRPMIEHVYRRASAARSVGVVIVATDDERICDAVEAFGGRAQMTSPAHQSGTDRLAEIADTLTADLVVNVQGDEPL